MHTLQRILLALGMAILAVAVQPSPAQTHPADDKLGYGDEGLNIAPAIVVNTTSPRTVKLLGEAQKAAGGSAKLGLTAELGATKRPEAGPWLRVAMMDADAAIRAEAARSAGWAQLKDLAPDVARLMKDAQPLVRREAVIALSRLSESASADEPITAPALNDPDGEVVEAAIAHARTAADARALLAALPKLSPTRQVKAMVSLGRLLKLERAPAVAQLAGSEDVALRTQALITLGQLGASAHAAQVSSALSDRHPTVRRAAITALGRLVEPATAQARAIAMLTDSDPSVAAAAAGVLADHPTADAVTPLVARLDSDYSPLHDAARAALAAGARDPTRSAVIAAAAAMLDSANPRRREDGSYLLGHLRSDARLDRHIELLNVPDILQEVDWSLVRQAAESLGQIGDSKAGAALYVQVLRAPTGEKDIQPSKDPTGMARTSAAAIVAVGQLRYAPALPHVRQLAFANAKTADPTVHVPGIWALGVLSPDASSQTAGKLLGVYKSEFEGEDAIFEAMKALGNLRAKGALDRVRKIEEESSIAKIKWAAHWAADRIAGVTTAYTPPIESWTADTSIRDLSQ